MVHISDKTEVSRMSKEMPSGSVYMQVFIGCELFHEVKKVK